MSEWEVPSGPVGCACTVGQQRRPGLGVGEASQPGSGGPLTSAIRSRPFLTPEGCRQGGSVWWVLGTSKSIVKSLTVIAL